MISILIAFLAFLLISVQATNPGVCLHITEKGLQYGEFKHFLLGDYLTQFIPAEELHKQPILETQLRNRFSFNFLRAFFVLTLTKCVPMRA